MQRIPSDYVVPEQDEFDSVPDGQYTGEGLEFFTIDETTKRPILVSQKNGKMVARARIKTSEGQEPPISLDLNQAKLMVMAFGGDVAGIAEIPTLDDIEGVANYLEFCLLHFLHTQK